MTHRVIPGYDGYAATIEGHIVRLRDGLVLTENLRTGRARVTFNSPNGSTTAAVDKLVALAFLGGGPGTVLHRDGDVFNCCPDNLEWDPDTVPVDPRTITDLREIESAPGFFVEPGGNVYSIHGPHMDGLLRRIKGSPSNNGYLNFDAVVDGRRRTLYIHRIVCATFNGPPPDSRHDNACHRNDIKTDNRASNLYWGTKKQNTADAISNGRVVPGQIRGEDSGRAVVTEEQVREIRRRRAAGESGAALAREFNLHPTSVRLMCQRKTWTHVE